MDNIYYQLKQLKETPPLHIVAAAIEGRAQQSPIFAFIENQTFPAPEISPNSSVGLERGTYKQYDMPRSWVRSPLGAHQLTYCGVTVTRPEIEKCRDTLVRIQPI